MGIYEDYAVAQAQFPGTALLFGALAWVMPFRTLGKGYVHISDYVRGACPAAKSEQGMSFYNGALMRDYR